MLKKNTCSHIDSPNGMRELGAYGSFKARRGLRAAVPDWRFSNLRAPGSCGKVQGPEALPDPLTPGGSEASRRLSQSLRGVGKDAEPFSAP